MEVAIELTSTIEIWDEMKSAVWIETEVNSVTEGTIEMKFVREIEIESSI